MIIEKDFKAKMDYSPIVARPRSIFANEYFMVDRSIERKLLIKYGEYFKLFRENKHGSSYGNIYKCDLKSLWEDKFYTLSFPQFKFKFHSKDESLHLFFLDHILPVLEIEVELKGGEKRAFIDELNHYIKIIANKFGELAKDRKYFSIEDLSITIQKETKKNKYFCDNLASIIIYSSQNYDRMMKKNTNFYSRFIKHDESRDKYVLLSSNYSGFINWISQDVERLFSNINTKQVSEKSYETFIPKTNKESIEKTFILLGLIEAMGLILYRVNGGDNPEIFIRINSRFQLVKVSQEPDKYRNIILENVYRRHKISVAMLTYLFENEVETEKFWNLIEDYFLGIIPNEVMERVEKVKVNTTY